ncbi:MAG: L,D-transpeptidase [Clostridia bacterium]|nr:L,D-transpeptidase [Clostridia bacterium]
MKRRIFISAISVLLALCFMAPAVFARDLKVVEALGEYPRPEQQTQTASVVNTISVSFLRASDSLKKNQPVICEVQFDNIPDGTYAILQWVQDGEPLENGYYSNFGMYNGAVLTLSTVLPHYGEPGESTMLGIDINIDGVLRREVISIPYADGTYYDERTIELYKKVQPITIPAKITKDTAVYSGSGLKTVTGYVSAGDSVTYYDHNEEYSAYIRLKNGNYAWAPYSAVSVGTGNYYQSGDYTTEEKEAFVNAAGFSSTTSYLIWVNTLHQKVHIFMGQKGDWKLYKTCSCATGANKTPTPLGIYKYCARDTAWIKPEYQVRPILYIDIGRGLAFHSRLYSPDGSVLIDGTMGRPASHGCIRMMDDDIRWMELYMTFGTTVVVY